MKIIFDRSAFHGEDFDLLKSSRLSELVRKREVLVFHTMVLLEETLRMIEAHEDELKRQWPFCDLYATRVGLSRSCWLNPQN